MNTPPGLLGAAILFWGWQAQAWWIAVPLALAFEAARFAPLRWDWSAARLNRIGDTCTVLTILAGAYFLVVHGNPGAIIRLFLWLPVLLMPLAAAQALGAQPDMALSVLFWSLRRRPPQATLRINLGFPYFALWVVAAAAANRRDGSFEAGLLALLVWALWSTRERSRSATSWLAAVAAAVVIGHAGHLGLERLQAWMSDAVPGWLTDGGGSRTDPYRADMDIGHIGELKQSDRIVLRVRSVDRFPQPLLLHRASYERYSGLRWLATKAAFKSVAPSADGRHWPLDTEPGELREITVVEQTPAPDPVLSLPAGTRRVEAPAVGGMRRNELGAVQVDHPPGFLEYRVAFVPGRAHASPPTDEDLQLPPRDAGILKDAANRLGLDRMRPQQAVEALAEHFRANFRYRLYQSERPWGRSPLHSFLLDTRAGHCEHFASATVLLLRAAGIPARYATGFSMQEWSDFEQAYLVRQRHAHAWARVWLDGAWQEVDTTPPDWVEAEEEATPWWSGMAGYGQWLRLKLWELQADAQSVAAVSGLLGALLLGWIAWRLFGRSTGARRQKVLGRAPGKGRSRDDSPYARIEERMKEMGWPRSATETPREWLQRIRSGSEDNTLLGDIESLQALHYRYRFDPAGLRPEEMAGFVACVDAWLARHPAGPAHRDKI